MVDQTLTIVYRGGEFLVAGYARDWDWNSHLADGSVETIMGGCDIDFLGGRGVVVGRAGRRHADRREFHTREAHRLVG